MQTNKLLMQKKQLVLQQKSIGNAKNQLLTQKIYW